MVFGTFLKGLVGVALIEKDLIKRVYDSWKRRFRAIPEKNWLKIEGLKDINSRKLSLKN